MQYAEEMTILMKQGSTEPTFAAALAGTFAAACDVLGKSWMVPLTCPLPTKCCMLSRTGMSLGRPLAAGQPRPACVLCPY